MEKLLDETKTLPTFVKEIILLDVGLTGAFVNLVILILGEKLSISFEKLFDSSFPSRSNADLRLTGAAAAFTPPNVKTILYR